MPDTKQKAKEKNKADIRRPLRMCCVCRMRREKQELFRIVRLPEGTLCIDDAGKACGRGAYLCRRPECIVQGGKRRALERSLKADADPALYEKLEDLLGTG